VRRTADPQSGPDAGAYRRAGGRDRAAVGRARGERCARTVELTGRSGFTETGIAMCLRACVEADAL
jgi:hypothetical protein